MLGNPALGFLPLGFVDDDPGLHGAEVQGYPVHGGNGELLPILARLEASDLVITAAGVTPERRNEIAALCRRAGVRLLNFQVQWDAEPAPAGTPAALGGPAA
jgi:FlaA1/EpsC-like NDP-sugar epimerase